MKVAGGHLSYCTNIHAGESWTEHFDSLKRNFPQIREAVAGDQAMGIGLRLSNAASLDLMHEQQRNAFKDWLAENNAYVFTMNGFPYGNFHHAVVKDQVHAPDWTTDDRLQYTLRLFDVLASLVPKGVEGGISTSPLTYKYWFDDHASLLKARSTATANIVALVSELYLKRVQKGVLLHLDIEPEPDGMLETGREFIDWYISDLLPMALKTLPAQLGISESDAETAVRDHVNLCYDVCHFAIGYEHHQDVIAELNEKKIKVGKIQISAALKADFPDNRADRSEIAEAFRRFDEPTYLHQVVGRTADDKLIRYPDLPIALANVHNSEVKQWRAHFHVPVFIADMGLLQSTQSDIVDVLKLQTNKPFTNHMEVETYTWEVLPDTLKVPIDQSIIRELNWVAGRI